MAYTPLWSHDANERIDPPLVKLSPVNLAGEIGRGTCYAVEGGYKKFPPGDKAGSFADASDWDGAPRHWKGGSLVPGDVEGRKGQFSYPIPYAYEGRPRVANGNLVQDPTA